MVIRLSDMLFYAYHGVLEQEKKEGNTFRVTVCLQIPTPPVPSDDIQSTLDYRLVYDVVAKEMEQPSNLLEHVAGRIRAALQKAFPQAQDIHVRVAKQQPPLPGPVAWAEVEL